MDANSTKSPSNGNMDHERNNTAYYLASSQTIHMYADDIVTISEDRQNVSYWNSNRVEDEKANIRTIRDVPLFFQISKDFATGSHSSGQELGFHSDPKYESSNYSPIFSVADLSHSHAVGESFDLKECCTSSTLLTSSPLPTTPSSTEDSIQSEESYLTTSSSESRVLSIPSLTQENQNQSWIDHLPESAHNKEGNDEDSIQSEESSLLSADSFSTLMSSDDSSESSLFSEAASFIRNDRTVSSQLSIMSMKMRKLFDNRERELRRLSLGNKGYRIYLSRQEELVQQNALKRLSHEKQMSRLSKASIAKDQTQSNKSSNHYNAATKSDEQGSTEEKDPIDQHSLMYYLQRRFLFERYHTAPCLGVLLTYIVAHISCYDFLHQLFMNTFLRFSNFQVAYGMSFVVGFALLRLTGSIWNWCTVSLYDGVKFDMHNKLRLGDGDAMIIRWINKRILIRQFLSILGIYLCFISVEYAMSELLLPRVCRVSSKVIEELPSQIHGMDTWLVGALKHNRLCVLKDISEVANDATTLFNKVLQNNDDQCMVSVEDLHEADEAYLFSKLSYYSYFALYGWGEKAPMLSSNCQIGLSLINAVASVSVLFFIGVGFWDD
jgi:hypothetical protein